MKVLSLQAMSDQIPKPEQGAAFRDAKVLAHQIAKRERVHEDLVFADAMHVAAAFALETEDLPYTKANIAWMFGRIGPDEVREILALRWNYPADYEFLPMAGATENLSATDIVSATELAKNLTLKQIDALFFSDNVGRC
jgi:hypothetical protein